MDYLLRAGALEGFSEQVLELGGIPEDLYKAVKIEPQTLSNPENMISYRAFLQLLDIAAHNTNSEHFGLLLSRKQSLNMFGAVGLIMRESADVRAALNDLIRFFHLHNQGSTVELKEDGKFAYLHYTVDQSGVLDVRQQEDLAGGVGLNFMRILCGKNWSPNSQYFMHSAPKDIRPFHQLFRCPIHFSQEMNCMVFDAEVLNIKLASSDEQLHEILQQHLGLQATQNPHDFSSNIKQLITKAMLSGDCSIDRVASYLAVNKRTLQRQLKEHSLSFKSLLEEVRFNTAIKYLKESTISLTQIADILCYHDISAFSRAFKRHCDMPPQQWREQNRH